MPVDPAMTNPSWSVLFLALGLAAIVAEVFVPSGGIIGLFAASCLLGSLAIAFAESFHFGLIMMLIEMITVPVAVGVAFQAFPRTRLGKRILLRPPEQSEGGSGMTDATSRWVGRVGLTSSALRPTGFVLINGTRLEARSRDGWIDSSKAIRVVAVRLGHLVVVEASEDATTAE